MDVAVPVPTVADPPAELAEAVPVEVPQFIAPADPEAFAALSRAGAEQVLDVWRVCSVRLKAWRAFGSAGGDDRDRP